ncbi:MULTISPECIES: class II aldolase/adducin family protein [unclassified Rhodococcus (in: high G+C Gram-positive bacteria)]|uniref:class II aldolase/adducin family protein n=1 Tax=unclassified Rhodococcus (in: high G+C Gram-positive bacteria) TaxID=192944 RepID=UPI00163A1C8B|nr:MULTISPECIES: class II aldolase/adducin family protein [unclassified Rhodococcus (in: high G+C Gram-positive bacteria)]MBC2642207.1 class II aldolase/adducin family protein [Rhodococcus sp. 3A]MBC2893051.1 class II aldolase/adducin family protein [Rhodococcus sp. 4CII]
MSAPTVTSQDCAEPVKTEAELRRELAAVYRLLAHFKMTDLIFTHVSVRLPGPEHHFLINPYGLLFEEITASNLVKIGLDGELVEPSEYRVNPAGFVIHGAIHEARADAQCVLHTHTKAGCAVAAQERGLLPLNQISMEFYSRVGYHDYEGIALNSAERERLVEDLGNHPAMILRNHGLLTVGETAAEAFLRMFYLEKACDIQIAAQASGELRVPSSEIAEHTARQFAGEAATDDYTDDQAYEMAWAALLRLLDRTAPDYKD